MSDCFVGNREAARQLRLAAAIEIKREPPLVVAERLVGRAWHENKLACPAPEAFRPLLGLLSPGDAVQLRFAGSGPQGDVEVAVELILSGGVGSGSARHAVVTRALRAALAGC